MTTLEGVDAGRRGARRRARRAGHRRRCALGGLAERRADVPHGRGQG